MSFSPRSRHELRTPLNAILAGRSLLRGDPADTESVDEGSGDHRAQRPRAEPDHRRPAGHEPDHLRQGAPGRAARRTSRRSSTPPSRPCDRRRKPRTSACRPCSTRRRGPVTGDPNRLATGLLEPAVQRDQVHARGRPRAGAPRTGQFAPGGQRDRHRRRHRRRFSAARVSTVSGRRMLPPRASTAGWDWGWPSSSNWSNSTAARCGPRAQGEGRAPRLSFSALAGRAPAAEQDLQQPRAPIRRRW